MVEVQIIDTTGDATIGATQVIPKVLKVTNTGGRRNLCCKGQNPDAEALD